MMMMMTNNVLVMAAIDDNVDDICLHCHAGMQKAESVKLYLSLKYL